MTDFSSLPLKFQFAANYERDIEPAILEKYQEEYQKFKKDSIENRNQLIRLFTGIPIRHITEEHLPKIKNTFSKLGWSDKDIKITNTSDEYRESLLIDLKLPDNKESIEMLEKFNESENKEDFYN